jgi:hypothetical protein
MISRHEHLLERSDSRGGKERYSRSPSRPLEPKPHRTTRVAAPLTLRCQLRRIRPHAHRLLTRVRAPAAPGWVSRSRKPSDGAPSRRLCRPRARRKNEPLTLPVATPRGRSLATPPEPLLPPLRQKRWVSRPEAPSLDELPARCLLSPTPRTRTRHRTAGFTTRGRLPTLFRSSLR